MVNQATLFFTERVKCETDRISERMYVLRDTINYLSVSTMISQNKKKKINFIIGLVFILFFGFGAVYGLLYPDDPTHKFIVIYVIMMLPGVFFLLNSFRIGKQIDLARRYETILSGDRDGIVNIRELTAQTGKDELKVMTELDTLFNKGFFQGCSLRREGSPAVIINDAQVGEDSVGFASITCPKCGGATRIRAGGRGVCSYCHSPISDE